MPADFLTDEEMEHLSAGAAEQPGDFISDDEMAAIERHGTTDVDPAVREQAIAAARASNAPPEQKAAFERALATAPPTERVFIPKPAEGPPKRLPPGHVDSGTAAIRGFKQGATFGFADELAGAGSAVTGGSYREGRDAAREADRAAREAHPSYVEGGEAVGALATAPALAALPAAATATIPRLAATGSVVGGLGAAGRSEADLTEGELGRFALDTAKGAGLGAAISGALPAGGAAARAAGRAARKGVEALRSNPAVAENVLEAAGSVAGSAAGGPLGAGFGKFAGTGLSRLVRAYSRARANPERFAGLKDIDPAVLESLESLAAGKASASEFGQVLRRAGPAAVLAVQRLLENAGE